MNVKSNTIIIFLFQSLIEANERLAQALSEGHEKGSASAATIGMLEERAQALVEDNARMRSMEGKFDILVDEVARLRDAESRAKLAESKVAHQSKYLVEARAGRDEAQEENDVLREELNRLELHWDAHVSWQKGGQRGRAPESPISLFALASASPDDGCVHKN